MSVSFGSLDIPELTSFKKEDVQTNSADSLLALRHICIEKFVSLSFRYCGYKQELLENQLTPLEKALVVCCRCDGVMRDPQFTDKGYKCGSCLDQEEIVKPAEINQVEIDKLLVHCPFKDLGCIWSNKLSSLVPHLSVCGIFPTICPLGCKQTIKREYLKCHKEEWCIERDTKCEHCNCVMKVSQTITHNGTCPSFPLTCVNGCNSQSIARTKMNHHTSKECPLSLVPCPFKRYGCSTVRKRRDIETHEAEFVVKHVRMMSLHIEEMEEVSQYSRGVKWEINGVRDKFVKNDKLYSKPFFVNHYKFKGYVKFLSSKGYLSVYVSLVVGENDDTLVWPFLGNVIITLVNKENPKFSISNSFLTASNDSFTKRTLLDRQYHGFPKFLNEREVLSSKFSQGDSILLKFEIQHMPESSIAPKSLSENAF